MCLAHLHSKANISAKFHENWSKTEEVVRDARLATDRPTDDTLIPIYPPYTLRVCGGITIQTYTHKHKVKDTHTHTHTVDISMTGVLLVTDCR